MTSPPDGRAGTVAAPAAVPAGPVPAAGGARHARAPRRAGTILLVLIGAQFMISLDATIVNVALPSIRDDLRVGQGDLGWVVNAYALAFGGLLLLGARLGDILGRRRMFVAGTAVFSAASLWCGLAGSAGQLVAARALQGVGAALMSPVAMALILAIFQGPGRHRALGLWGSMSGLAGGSGMLVGGLLSTLSWRWNFFINVPVGVLIAVVAWRRLAESAVPRSGRPDVLGAVLCTTGVSLAVFAVVRTSADGWAAWSTGGLLAVAALLIAAFPLWERRAADPIVPLRIFRNRNVSVGNVLIVLTGGVGQVMYFTLTLYAQQALGYSPLASGAVFLPISAAIYLTSTRASWLVRRIGLRAALSIGLVLSAVALAWLAAAPVDGSYPVDILVPSVLWGFGWGLAQAASFIAGAQGIGEDLAGVASGLIATTYRVGGAATLAVMTTVAVTHTAALTPSGRSPTVAALDAGFGYAFLGAAGLGLLGALLSWLLPRTRRDRPSG